MHFSLGFNLESNHFIYKCLDEDLHATTKMENEVKGQLSLNVIIQQCAAILKSLTCEDEALPVGRDAVLVPNL